MHRRPLPSFLLCLALAGCASGSASTPPRTTPAKPVAARAPKGPPTFANGSFRSKAVGGTLHYEVALPPGYATSARRYPVVYFLHGYGQEPNDLVDLSAIFANYMISTAPIESRFQKFIIVYVDGRCRPHNDGVPVMTTGDGCEEGTFYMDAPLGGTARMEQNLLDLMDYIDANYRTKQASMAEVTP